MPINKTLMKVVAGLLQRATERRHAGRGTSFRIDCRCLFFANSSDEERALR
jgi:tRNA G37 N-methylase Trm5